MDDGPVQIGHLTRMGQSLFLTWSYVPYSPLKPPFFIRSLAPFEVKTEARAMTRILAQCLCALARYGAAHCNRVRFLSIEDVIRTMELLL